MNNKRNFLIWLLWKKRICLPDGGISEKRFRHPTRNLFSEVLQNSFFPGGASDNVYPNDVLLHLTSSSITRMSEFRFGDKLRRRSNSHEIIYIGKIAPTSYIPRSRSTSRFLPESTGSSQASIGQFWARILLLLPAISGVFLQDPVARNDACE